MASILLVDDDALTLSLLSPAAQNLGHIPIMTLSALHAVELESPRRIRLHTLLEVISEYTKVKN